MENIALLNPPLVRINNPARIIVTGLLIAITAVLPALVHTLGLNGAVLLPMHWTVLLCGLVFGPLGGLAAGAFSPIISFMLSGLPKLPILLPMTFELAAYGFFAGIFRKLKLDTIVSTVLAMIAGRLVYTLAMFNAVKAAGSIINFWEKSFAPGLVAALIMLVVLPAGAYMLCKLLYDKKKS